MGKKISSPVNDIKKEEYKDLSIQKSEESAFEIRTFGDFHEEFVGKICKIQVPNYPIIVGTVKEARAYWIKVETSEKKILYINKAYVISVEPVSKT
jgi:hypothetical protein